MRKGWVVILLVLFFLPDFVDAQSFYRRRRDREFIGTFGTGVSSYYGDINNPGDYLDTKLNFVAGLEYKLHPYFSPKIMFSMFRLEGDDRKADKPGRVRRNLRFRSDNIEIAIVGMGQIFPERQRYYQRPQVNFYGFLGVGVLYYNPRAELPETDWNGDPIPDAGKYVSLRKLETEGVKYGSFAMVIPFGLGVRYKVNPWFNLSVDGGFRLTFTDHLDDASTEYPGIAAFTDPIAAALSDRRHEIDLNPLPPGNQRGDPKENDGYFLLNIKAEYYLPQIFGGNTPGRRGGRRR